MADPGKDEGNSKEQAQVPQGQTPMLPVSRPKPTVLLPTPDWIRDGRHETPLAWRSSVLPAEIVHQTGQVFSLHTVRVREGCFHTGQVPGKGAAGEPTVVTRDKIPCHHLVRCDLDDRETDHIAPADGMAAKETAKVNRAGVRRRYELPGCSWTTKTSRHNPKKPETKYPTTDSSVAIQRPPAARRAEMPSKARSRFLAGLKVMGSEICLSIWPVGQAPSDAQASMYWFIQV